MKKFLIALATTVALVGPAHAEIVARDPDRIFDCSNVGFGMSLLPVNILAMRKPIMSR